MTRFPRLHGIFFFIKSSYYSNPIYYLYNKPLYIYIYIENQKIYWGAATVVRFLIRIKNKAKKSASVSFILIVINFKRNKIIAIFVVDKIEKSKSNGFSVGFPH